MASSATLSAVEAAKGTSHSGAEKMAGWLTGRSDADSGASTRSHKRGVREGRTTHPSATLLCKRPRGSEAADALPSCCSVCSVCQSPRRLVRPCCASCTRQSRPTRPARSRCLIFTRSVALPMGLSAACEREREGRIDGECGFCGCLIVPFAGLLRRGRVRTHTQHTGKDAGCAGSLVCWLHSPSCAHFSHRSTALSLCSISAATPRAIPSS